MKKLIKTLFITAVALNLGTAASDENPFLEGSNLEDLRARFVTTSVANPFREGVERVVLTDSERESLKAFADNAKSNLQRALDKAEGKTLEESNGIYEKAIIKVVLDSYEDSKRSELLMRYILNQALELTVGTPTPDGKAIETRGVLADVSNKDIITVILEDSIRLAIDFHKNDREAIEKNELIRLPYIEMATRRMALAEEWIASVHEWNLMLNMQIAVAEQWLTTVAGDGELRKVKVGEAILVIDEALNEVNDKGSSHSTLQKVRFLRGKFRWLRRALNEAGFSIGAVMHSPYGSAQEFAAELVVTTDIKAVDNFYLYEAVKSNSTSDIYGLGYSGDYYHRQEGSNKGFKNISNAQMVELLKTNCISMLNNLSSGYYSSEYFRENKFTGFACAPAGGIFQAPMKLSNEQFSSLAKRLEITLYAKK